MKCFKFFFLSLLVVLCTNVSAFYISIDKTDGNLVEGDIVVGKVEQLDASVDLKKRVGEPISSKYLLERFNEEEQSVRLVVLYSKKIKNEVKIIDSGVEHKELDGKVKTLRHIKVDFQRGKTILYIIGLLVIGLILLFIFKDGLKRQSKRKDKLEKKVLLKFLNSKETTNFFEVLYTKTNELEKHSIVSKEDLDELCLVIDKYQYQPQWPSGGFEDVHRHWVKIKNEIPEVTSGV